MQPSHPDLVAATVETDRHPSIRKMVAYTLGAGLLAAGVSLCDAAPVPALLLGLLGLLAVGLGQVKGPDKKSLRDSMRAAAMVSARMDSIVDNGPPSSAHPSSRRDGK